ncbi:MAG: hypothetical protein AAF298_07090 [Cyanobacteria bacterium P01_A01_bin.40]
MAGSSSSSNSSLIFFWLAVNSVSEILPVSEVDSNDTFGFSGQKVPSSSISLLVSLLATGVPASLARFSMALTFSGSRFERGISLLV